MEFKATPSKIRVSKRRRSKMDYGVFLRVASEYERPYQKHSADKKPKGKSALYEVYQRYAQTVDPTQLQVGESVYDDADSEYRVIENDPNTTNVVLMPADQVQQEVPEGVVTVDETEMGSYTIQPSGPQTTARKIAAEEDIDWADIQSAAIDVRAYATKQDLQGLVEALDYLNFLVIDQTESQGEADISSLFERAGRSRMAVLAEFDKEREMEVEDIEDLEDVVPGESGYTEIMKDIKSMVAEEVPVVDLILAIGEKYPRSMGEKVLADARSRGIF